MADSKPLLSITMDGETYVIDKLTLGNARLLKRDYGMEDLTQFNLVNPDVMTGVLVIAYARQHPELAHDEVVTHVEDIDAFSFTETPDEAEAAEDPTPAGTASAVVEPAGETGEQATIPGPDGGQA